MKKLMMMAAIVCTAVSLVGCSKSSKYESMTREAMSLIQDGKVDEAEVKKEVERFNKLSEEEQKKALEEAEKVLEAIKKEKETLEKAKKVLGK